MGRETKEGKVDFDTVIVRKSRAVMVQSNKGEGIEFQRVFLCDDEF